MHRDTTGHRRLSRDAPLRSVPAPATTERSPLCSPARSSFSARGDLPPRGRVTMSGDTLLDCHDWGAVLLASSGWKEMRVLLNALHGADGPRDSAICPDVRGARWRSQ